jgi:hypothetical protein
VDTKDGSVRRARNLRFNTPVLPGAASARLTVGLLVAGAGATTTELLGLAAAGIGDEEAAVVLDQGLLDLALRLLVDVLLVVCYNSLGDRLPDGCGRKCQNLIRKDRGYFEAF